ncbi:MAG: hypothetical protein RLZZ301_1867 [Bacteroidota bacterium]|jgi:hypothetical protein
MRKLLLTISAVALAVAAQAQVIVAGVSPQSIAGNYTFSWADPAGGDWACPDFLIPNTFVQDTLMLVDDGSTGTNAQGHPVAQEGCNPLINNLTGKIAVIYRNTCNFSAKALNAQNAGAVGVIIINRDPEAIAMGGGTAGVSVTIPVVMLSSTDGATLVNQMASGPVVVFMGNKQNMYETDGGSSQADVMISRYGSIPQTMANNGYTFDPGIQVYNFGSVAHDFTVNAKITGPSGVVYDNTVGPVNVLSGDTLPVFNGNSSSFPSVSLASWATGAYTLTYTIAIPGFVDSADSDNSFSSTFNVTSDVLSLASQDATTNAVTSTSYPHNATTTYQACMMVQDTYPTANTGVEGLYFSIKAPNDTIDGEEVVGEIFEWNDSWVDLSGGWSSITFDNLNQVGGLTYDYVGNAQNAQVVYAAFNSPVLLMDSQRYLVCLSTANPVIAFGFDKSLNYEANVSLYSQPVSALYIDNTTWYSGWSGGTNAVSIGLKVINNVGLDENATLVASAYPNPASDIVNIAVNAEGNATYVVTDLSGKVAMTGAMNLVGGEAAVNTSALQTGMYIFTVSLDNGKTAQFNVVKK